MLDQHAILQHTDLHVLTTLADYHGAVHGFPAGQELGLGEDRHPATACLTAVPATLALRLQPGRASHAAHLVAVAVALVASVLPALTDVHDRVRRVGLTVGDVVDVRALGEVGALGVLTPTPTPTPTAGAAIAFRAILVAGGIRSLGRTVGFLGLGTTRIDAAVRLGRVAGLGGILAGIALAAPAPASTTTAPAAPAAATAFAVLA